MAAAPDPDARQRHLLNVPLGNLRKHTVDLVLPRPPCKGSELSFAAPKTVFAEVSTSNRCRSGQ